MSGRATKARRLKFDASTATRAVILTRLSKERENGALSHGSQEAECRAKAAALGVEVVGVYRDDLSGDRLDRAGLWDAVDAIRDGRAELLIVHCIDRLSRGGQDQLGQIVYLVRKAGGDVVFASQDLPAGPIGDMIRSNLGFAAQIELFSIRERTKRGLETRFRTAGRPKPGPRPKYGYRCTDPEVKTLAEPDPLTAPVVQRIWADAARGLSRLQIGPGAGRGRDRAPGGGDARRGRDRLEPGDGGADARRRSVRLLGLRRLADGRGAGRRRHSLQRRAPG
ncbi:MAG: recombinase family protein [Thermomicrobiales bacterium]